MAKGAFTGQNRIALTCEQRGWVSRGQLTPEGWQVLQGARESPPARTGHAAPPKARALAPPLEGESARVGLSHAQAAISPAKVTSMPHAGDALEPAGLRGGGRAVEQGAGRSRRGWSGLGLKVLAGMGLVHIATGVTGVLRGAHSGLGGVVEPFAQSQGIAESVGAQVRLDPQIRCRGDSGGVGPPLLGLRLL